MQSEKTEKIIKVNPLAPEQALLKKAAEELRAGHSLIFPTDTVYGVGIAVLAQTDPLELMRIKQRPPSKSIPLLVGSHDDLEFYGTHLPLYAVTLAGEHWPGALTLVVKASQNLPRHFIHEDGSVALRMPAHPIALGLLNQLNTPIATSSANLSGQAPACSLDELDPDLQAAVSLIIDGGKVQSTTASTVVSCLGQEPHVLREGPVKIGGMGV